jgi:hypothetical protein
VGQAVDLDGGGSGRLDAGLGVDLGADGTQVLEVAHVGQVDVQHGYVGPGGTGILQRQAEVGKDLANLGRRVIRPDLGAAGIVGVLA